MRILIKKDPRYPLDVKEIRSIAKSILSNYDLPDEIELSINFVGKRKAKSLNEDYRNKDYIPKVLAFPMNEKGPDGVLRMGDLVICFPLARKEARKRQRMVSEIIEELLEHGINNLIKD
jgi:probable rRNA maturation factor